MVVNIKITVFWNVTQCSFIAKIEAGVCSETLVPGYMMSSVKTIILRKY
jgi:hypothetical protein